MTVYEQDWLNWQTALFPPLTQSATLGRTWLTQMGRAAERAGVTIQYENSSNIESTPSAYFT